MVRDHGLDPTVGRQFDAHRAEKAARVAEVGNRFLRADLPEVEMPGLLANVLRAWVKSWRSLVGYHERAARLQEVVVSFEPRTFEVIAER